MRIEKLVKNSILLLLVITVVMLSVEHYSSLAKRCVLTHKASATGENVCDQKLPFESYALSRDSSYGLIKEVITTIKSYNGTGNSLEGRFWFNALILAIIYMCLLLKGYKAWTDDTCIYQTSLRTIHYIHLRDGQK